MCSYRIALQRCSSLKGCNKANLLSTAARHSLRYPSAPGSGRVLGMACPPMMAGQSCNRGAWQRHAGPHARLPQMHASAQKKNASYCHEVTKGSHGCWPTREYRLPADSHEPEPVVSSLYARCRHSTVSHAPPSEGGEGGGGGGYETCKVSAGKLQSDMHLAEHCMRPAGTSATL